MNQHNIVIRQNDTNNIPGSRDDLVIGILVNIELRIPNTFKVLNKPVTWSLIDKPVGSEVELTKASTYDIIFTPDLEGTYLFQVARLDFVYRIGAAIKNNLGIRIPSLYETNEFGENSLFFSTVDAISKINYSIDPSETGDTYMELNRDGYNKIDKVTYWQDNTKTIKVKEVELERDLSGVVQNIITRQYNVGGVLIKTTTEEYARADGFVANVQYTVS